MWNWKRIFSKEGLLAHSLDDFEERPGQKEMAQAILSAYEQEGVALIEAGTGTGKSLAYLVPAVFWALKHKEKTVITTHTIALQEQLLHKDIPFLLNTLGKEIKACLVKGMSNYLCLRKLKELQAQPLLFSLDEAKEVQAIERWSEKTREGSRSDFNFSVSPATWEKVAAESDACSRNDCPHYKQCFFFKARKEAQEAQLLIVNHHLLMMDIDKRRRNPDQDSILPSYTRLVVDEAHHLEEIALEKLAQKFDRLSFLRHLAKLHSDAHPERSRLMLLRRELSALGTISPRLLQQLEIDIPAQKRACLTALEDILDFKEGRKRITEALGKQTVNALLRLSDEIQRLALLLQSVLGDTEKFKTHEKIGSHLLEMQAISQRLEESSLFLKQFTQEEADAKRVRWYESSPSNVTLVDATLDISELLQNHLFSKQRTSILCSATMATARSFAILKKRLGLDDPEQKCSEAIFESPFDYANRTLLGVPIDLPEPSSPDFLAEAAKVMIESIAISRGSAFLLFTSYDMLQSCYRLLENSPISKQYPLLRQNAMPRHLLIEAFKKREGSVLFGTDSFWEGVDVPGEALRSVVIVKLPFAVPSDPLYEAYAEALQKQGMNPFTDYSVPQAIIKFKQGFGRLMRKKEDRGSILCLDNRIVRKAYGKHFLQSLPKSDTCFGPAKEVFARMKQFYERTGA